MARLRQMITRGANAPFSKQLQGGLLALPLCLLTAPMGLPAEILAGYAIAGFLMR